MADWKDRLRPASFRGVAFGVERHSRQGGRRVGVHVFPQRDSPLVEEMGRHPRRFFVEAYLVGDDYATRLERLIDRLEGASAGYPQRPGGTLVHPTFGQVEVVCEHFEELESTEEGRMARVAIDFVEAGRDIQPFGAVDPVGATDRSGALVSAAQGDAYSQAVVTEGVIQEALDVIEDTIHEVDRRLRRLDVFSGSTRDVAALEAALVTLVGTASELVTSPADLVGTATDALDSVLGAASSASGALAAYRVLFDLEVEGIPGSGYQAQVAAANAAAAANLFRGLALAGAARAAARVEWASLEDALEARAELEALLDELSSGTDDDLNRELSGLRASIVEAIPPPGETLPQVVTVTLARALPALVLAHQRYQDPGRMQEIVDRNHLPNPMRVPGGLELLVLSR